jgi:hypothetical protein
MLVGRDGGIWRVGAACGDYPDKREFRLLEAFLEEKSLVRGGRWSALDSIETGLLGLADGIFERALMTTKRLEEEEKHRCGARPPGTPVSAFPGLGPTKSRVRERTSSCHVQGPPDAGKPP